MLKMRLEKTPLRLLNLDLLVCLSLLLIVLSCNSTPPGGLSEKGELQIGLVCSNLDRSLDFYKNVIGMQETGGFEVDGQFSTDAALSDGKAFKVRTLKLDNAPGGTTLKLACCSDSTVTARQKFVNETPGVKYLTFEVPSAKGIRERLQQRGIPLLGKTPVDMGEGTELIMVNDPDGVFVEIIGKRD